MIYLITAYIYALLVFSVVFFSESCGSPYSRTELIIRGLALPIVFPFLLVASVFDRLNNRF